MQLKGRLLATGRAVDLGEKSCRKVIDEHVPGGSVYDPTEPLRSSALPDTPLSPAAATTTSSAVTPRNKPAATPVLVALALAAGVMALLMGLLPISTYEVGGDSFGDDSVSCGSAWAPNNEELTGTGQAACAEGGLNVNRSLSFALLAAAVVLAGAAMFSTSSSTPTLVPVNGRPNVTGPAPD